MTSLRPSRECTATTSPPGAAATYGSSPSCRLSGATAGRQRGGRVLGRPLLGLERSAPGSTRRGRRRGSRRAAVTPSASNAQGERRLAGGRDDPHRADAGDAATPRRAPRGRGGSRAPARASGPSAAGGGGGRGGPAWANTELTTLHGPGSSARIAGGPSGFVLISPPPVVPSRRFPSRPRPGRCRARAPGRSGAPPRSCGPARRRAASTSAATGASASGVPSATRAPSAESAIAPTPSTGEGQLASGSSRPTSQRLIEPSAWRAATRGTAAGGGELDHRRARPGLDARRAHARARGGDERGVGGVAERARRPQVEDDRGLDPDVVLVHARLVRGGEAAAVGADRDGPLADARGDVAEARQHHARASRRSRAAGPRWRPRRRSRGRARAGGGRGRRASWAPSGCTRPRRRPPAPACRRRRPTPGAARRARRPSRAGARPEPPAASAGAGTGAKRSPRGPRSTRANGGTLAGSIGSMGGPPRLMPCPSPARSCRPSGSGARRAR